MKQKEKRINVIADDFGMSPGINKAIMVGVTDKLLDGAGIVANGHCFNEAITFVKEHKSSASWGLHFNCEYGKPVAPAEEVTALINETGNFHSSFLSLAFRYYLKREKALVNAIETELNAQLDILNSHDVYPDYIDSHRHIHTLPFVHKIVVQTAKERNINRIRKYRESIWRSFIQTRSINCLNPIVIFKWLLLNLLGKINDKKHNSYLFSIVLSSVLKPSYASRISFPEKYSRIEIMVHPGFPDLDADFYTDSKLVNGYIRSRYRIEEFNFINKLAKKNS